MQILSWPGALLVACLLLIPMAPVRAQCADCDADGLEWPADCNDASAGIHPEAAEVCDGFDNDCDGFVDNDPACGTACTLPDRAGLDQPVTNHSASIQGVALAWTGAVYGAAWHDRRDSPSGAAPDPGQIYFTLLDATGSKLIPDLRLTPLGSDSREPSLVWTGEEFGLAWIDLRDGNPEVYFTRLSPEGEPLGPELRLTTAPGLALEPDVAWNGRTYTVVWSDNRTGDFEIYSAQIDAAGSRVAEDARVTLSSGVSTSPSLVWAAPEFGLAWLDTRFGPSQIMFARLDEFGVKKAPEARITMSSATATFPALVWTGGEYGLAWTDFRHLGEIGGVNTEIYFVRLDPTGVALSPEVRITTAAERSDLPSLAWSGGAYGLAWHDGRDGQRIYFTRIGGDGGEAGRQTPATTVNHEATGPSLRWNGSSYGLGSSSTTVVYFTQIRCDCPDLDGDLAGSCQDCDDTQSAVYPGAPQICDGLNNDCLHPSWPALDGTNDGDGDHDGFTGCQGDCDNQRGQTWPGAPEVCDGYNNDCNDPRWPLLPPFETSDGDFDGALGCHDCDDSNALVYPGAHQQCDGINNDCDDPSWPTVPADELDADGDSYRVCTGGCDIRLTTTATERRGVRGASAAPELVWNGSQVAMVWSFFGTHDKLARFALLRPDGTRLTPIITVGVTESSALGPSPSMAWTGDEYGIVWATNRNVLSFDRYSETGVRIGIGGAVAGSPEQALEPHLTWMGSGYGLFWIDYRRDPLQGIRYVHLDAEGNRIGDDTGIFPLGHPMPSVAWDGEHLGLAWSDARDGNQEVYFALLSPEGERIIPDIRVTNDAAFSGEPRLVWNGSQYAVVWQDSRDGSLRLFFARLDAGGHKLGPETAFTPEGIDARRPSIDWSGSEYRVAWTDARDGDEDVYVMSLDEAGNPLGSSRRVAIVDGVPFPSAITWVGFNYAMAWADRRDQADFGYTELYYRLAFCQDCDDGSTDVHPAAPEFCDGLDNNCDASIDDACVNRDPIAMAGGNRSLECNGRLTQVELNGSGSTDPDGHLLTYRWTGPFPEGGGQIDGAVASVSLPVGESGIEVEVEDELGGRATDSITVHVQDTTPPSLELSPEPGLLWPPNHRMIAVQVGVQALDACGDATYLLESLTSNEADDAPGPGDGNSRDDIQEAELGTPDQAFLLRAERDGGKDGRVYTAMYRAVDEHGNPSVAGTIFLVPHDRSGVTEPMILGVAQTGSSARISWQPIPDAKSYEIIRGSLSSLRDEGAVFYLGQYREDGFSSGYRTGTAVRPRGMAATEGTCP